MPDGPPGGLRAVLWDMDGTLVDSERLWDVSMAGLAAHLGGELGPALRAELTGSSLHHSVTAVRRALGHPVTGPAGQRGVAESGRWLLDRTAALFGTELRWLRGAREALDSVRAAGLATALVTNTYRELTEVALDVLGRDRFDVTVCGDEVAATKPDPAPYRRAAELLAVDPAACLAVEDSPTGVRAAAGSGAAVLVVGEAAGAEATGRGRVHRSDLAGVDATELGRSWAAALGTGAVG